MVLSVLKILEGFLFVVESFEETIQLHNIKGVFHLVLKLHENEIAPDFPDLFPTPNQNPEAGTANPGDFFEIHNDILLTFFDQGLEKIVKRFPFIGTSKELSLEIQYHNAPNFSLAYFQVLASFNQSSRYNNSSTFRISSGSAVVNSIMRFTFG